MSRQHSRVPLDPASSAELPHCLPAMTGVSGASGESTEVARTCLAEQSMSQHMMGYSRRFKHLHFVVHSVSCRYVKMQVRLFAYLVMKTKKKDTIEEMLSDRSA